MLRHIPILTFGLLLLAAAAFWPTYVAKDWAAVDRYTHVHAALGTLWLFVLIGQPVLIRGGHRRAHRMAGRASMFVAVGFVVSGVLLTHYRASRMAADVFAKEGVFIYLPLAVAAVFAAACVLGWIWRTSASVHARFMLSTALLLVDPVVARLMFVYLPPLPSDRLYQGTTFSLIAIVMAGLVNSLPAQAPGRLCYRNYCIVTVAVLASFFVVPQTGAWLVFVNAFRSLPLT